ncbi:MAG: hypothetical protein HY595_06210, partial [Candidatus Omnitrophica bacterium]|nr:hypothetical protein [Candidatus Omnitrophota bacterium]
WHMHQPYYRNLLTGECFMPWVRLHATKDYLDMVKILEEFPSIHQTFNFVPGLLDQLQAYLPPTNQSDYFLELSKKPATDLTEDEQRFLVTWFFLANGERMIKPHPRYHDLWTKRSESANRFKPQDYLDLQVWFNLAWIDPWLRQHDPQLAELEAKGARFTEAEKSLVLTKHLDYLSQCLPAYRAAQARGQVELTTSPYYHPITPLLCDTRCARIALPNLSLPEPSFRHPEDARWQLTQAVKRHEELFGRRPNGLWPPEGGVSEAVAELALEAGFQWCATDEEILWRSLKTVRTPMLLYRPHVVNHNERALAILFRDRELSDLLGFVYSQWEDALAVRDFVNRLSSIHQQLQHAPTPPLVTIALDGENAWEHYAQDGGPFLRRLYHTLASDARFRFVTVTEFLQQFPPDRSSPLPELFPGSWIDGNFSTWVGHPEKNTAWSHLARAREAMASAGSREELPQAWQNLSIAEGSDWMWWYGDTHYSAQQEDFDRLFRTHLANVYRSLQQEVPADLEAPIKTPIASVPSHEPSAPMTPILDGRETTYYEWLYAGRLDLHKSYGALHRGQQLCHALSYGFDASTLSLRVDLDTDRLTQFAEWRIEVSFPDRRLRASFRQSPSGLSIDPPSIRGAFDRILEASIPLVWLALKPGESCCLILTVFQGADLVERYPAQGTFRLSVPSEGPETSPWSA